MAYPLLLFMVFYVYLNLNSFVLAFQRITLSGKRSFVGLENFIKFFKSLNGNDLAGASILNSLKIWWINFSITFPLNMLFSYYIYRKFPGHGVFRLVVLLPSVISVFVMSLVFKTFVENVLPDIMIQTFGLESFPQLLFDRNYNFNTVLFYMVWLSFATSLILYSNSMNNVDQGLLESARIDGANMFQEFGYILLPMIWPTITTFIVTSSTGMFLTNGPLLTFYMYEAPDNLWGMSYFLLKNTMSGGNEILSYPYLSAAGYVMTIATAPVVFLIKYIMERIGAKTE